MIHDSGYYKPILPVKDDQDWIEQYPENWREEMYSKEFPKVKYP